MFAKSAILTDILLASVVLAVPSSSQLEARLSRRRENRHIDARDDARYQGTWSGAVLEQSQGTFTSVTGTFIIPTLNGSDCSSTAWVGIDGDSCRSAIWQAGVDLVITGGKVEYNPWYEWYPDAAYYFSEFSISAGDEIRTTVTASSMTSGKVIMENLTTNKTVIQEVSSNYSLCQQDAEWIIEDFEVDIPFANFGTFKFNNATASGPGGSQPPEGAVIFDIERDNVILTSVSVSGDTVTIQHV